MSGELGLIDISHLIEGASPANDDISIIEVGLLPGPPIEISGTWRGHEDAVAGLAVKVTLANTKRLPRRTKKAFKKVWLGRHIKARERKRLATIKEYKT